MPLQESNALKSFEYPVKIQTKITYKNGEYLTGFMVYNLHKERNVEYLYGYDIEGLLHAIPFAKISSITPKNKHYSIVELKNRKSLLLGNTMDTSEFNDGMLVYSNELATYIAWKEIQKIEIYN